MRHLILLGLILTGLGLGAYFTVHYLHHGDLSPGLEEKAFDQNLASMPKDQLWPERGSEIIFGKTSFEETNPDLERTEYLDEVFRAGSTVARGWIVKDSNDKTEIARVYWNDVIWWRSRWYHLGGEDYIAHDAINITSHVSGLAGDTFLTDSEIVFGRTAFSKIYPNLEKTENVETLFSRDRVVARGWIVKESGDDNDSTKTDVARLYWTNNAYWVSDWHHIAGNAYIAAGTLYTHTTGWDGSNGNNWAIIFGIMMGELILAIMILILMEMLFEDNEDWQY